MVRGDVVDVTEGGRGGGSSGGGNFPHPQKLVFWGQLRGPQALGYTADTHKDLSEYAPGPQRHSVGYAGYTEKSVGYASKTVWVFKMERNRKQC